MIIIIIFIINIGLHLHKEYKKTPEKVSALFGKLANCQLGTNGSVSSKV